MTNNAVPAVRPMFWPELVAIMIDVAILIALFSWAFSIARKAWRGEEIEMPIGGR
jgi:uncharacterized membrane protein